MPPPNALLGPYEIVAPVGAGGMGEVYRAKDCRLGRDVALKILPAALAFDPERQHRFITEARAVSALSHPNILAVYDVGVANGSQYLVCELIDGVPIAREIERGPLPLKRLLEIAAQIADGLAAAHDAGIVHLDLKPDNVMVTREGRVKILDFGLAQFESTEPHGAHDAPKQTETAVIRGTAPYMSPEQARGGVVDFRSDQFSFGSMLYEMATGAQPFCRDTAVQTMSSVITDEPPAIRDVSPRLPLPLIWLIERCLSKDPAGRYASTTDLARELAILRDRVVELSPRETERKRSSRLARRLLPIAVAGSAALAVFLSSRSAALAPDFSAYRFTPFASDPGYQGAPVWSPDGQTIAYVAETGGVLQVFRRSLASSMRTQLTHSAFDCHDPFWSADGTRVYYVSLAGERDGLYSVSAAGGLPALALENVASAALSPDGRTLVFLRAASAQGSFLTLWFSSPPDAEPHRYPGPLGHRNTSEGIMRFAPDGSKLLVWVYGERGDRATSAKPGGFWIVPQPAGTPYAALDRLSARARTTPAFSWFPDSRHIAIALPEDRTPGAHLWIADTDGDTLRAVTASSASENSPAVSPDAAHIAYTVEDTDFDLVMIPNDGSAARPILATSRNEMDPAWSPSGYQYAFVTDRTGTQEIWLRSQDGRWERPLVTDSAFGTAGTIVLGAPAFSPDGQWLSYQRLGPEGYRVWLSPLTGGAAVRLTSEQLYEDAPTWSPDGKWIALTTSDESGHWNLVKVQDGGAVAPVVLKRGLTPMSRPDWSPDGRWIAADTDEGLELVSPTDGDARVISDHPWLAHGWSSDSSTVYGLRQTDEARRFMLVAVDAVTRKERTIVPDLGPIPFSNEPIRGFSRVGSEGFATSISRVRSDIWLLDGFPRPGSLIERVFGWWPPRR